MLVHKYKHDKLMTANPAILIVGVTTIPTTPSEHHISSNEPQFSFLPTWNRESWDLSRNLSQAKSREVMLILSPRTLIKRL